MPHLLAWCALVLVIDASEGITKAAPDTVLYGGSSYQSRCGYIKKQVKAGMPLLALLRSVTVDFVSGTVCSVSAAPPAPAAGTRWVALVQRSACRSKDLVSSAKVTPHTKRAPNASR